MAFQGEQQFNSVLKLSKKCLCKNVKWFAVSMTKVVQDDVTNADCVVQVDHIYFVIPLFG